MRYLKQYIPVIILAVSFSACQPGNIGFEVQHHGVLREIMMQQKLQANADLSEFSNTPNLYALGALEGLSGEIMIVDSRPSYSIADAEGVSVEGGFNKKATLLVTSQVAEWSEMPLDISWLGLETLQAMIKEAAIQSGLSTDQPFPFMLKGNFDKVDWHIINAARAEQQNHDAYKEAGASGSTAGANGQILGFYSESHEGVFTHHGSYVHLHFINDDKSLMGHVDDLSINGKVSLLLPKTAKN